MPPQQPTPSSGIKWNQVTWYSKLGAIILFIGVVPALMFYIGTQYELAQQSLLTPLPVQPITPSKSVTTASAPAFQWIAWSEVSTSTSPYIYYSEKNGALYADAVEGTQSGVGTFTTNQIITGADSSTFVVAQDPIMGSGEYAKDKSHVYYIYIGGDADNDQIVQQIISGADPSTFTVLSGAISIPNTTGSFEPEAYAEDNNHVYDCSYQNEQYVCGPILNADVSTFKVFSAVQNPSSSSAYDAQDKNHTYLNGQVVN